MHSRSASVTANVVIGLVIVAAIVAAAVAVLRIDTFGVQSPRPVEGVNDGLQELRQIDPALIQYEQTGEIPVAMRQIRALAVGPNDRIYVAGDRTIHVFDPQGASRQEIALNDQPWCLTVASAEHTAPGRIYVGMKNHVEVYTVEGEPEATWESLGEKAWLTSIAVAEEDVFTADAGNKIVWRFDTSGKRLRRIGDRDDKRRIPGFRITSAFFDLAVSPDGLLRVVNPRMLRIEAYTFDGDLELFWGKSSPTVEGFFGCCNPAHFAVLSDGRFVTAEKGIVRVKIYSEEGEFLHVVATPQQLSGKAADVAVDGRDRILILDAKAKRVRIFEHKPTVAGVQP